MKAEKIANEIREYKGSEKPGWWRTGEWMRLFHSIRGALYSDEITLQDYKALMDMLMEG